ncbi:MAG: hypothetical protein EHM31_07585 [Candidatus Aminicenantes bacterium]|nr:MAG: hypothetical protein EHM31_07585 [Candidatus Aminicenantes bacterium]
MRRTSSVIILGSAVIALILVLVPACGRGDRGPALTRPVVGVKIYEASPPFEGLFKQWRGLGINTLFVSDALLRDAGFRDMAKSEGLSLFLIFPVFQNPGAIKEDPGLAAITSAGAPARDEWVEFVCPAREDYLRRKVDQLKSLIAEGDPYAVSLDFIRYFVFWEKVTPDRAPESLPQTCFCPVCLAGFAKETGVVLPAEPVTTAEKAKWILTARAAEWTEWKCRTIARAVARLAAAAREVKPSIKVNLHAVPWRHDDFGGAVRAVAGQDLVRLAPHVDLISPMCYHHMARRDPAWVHDVVADISSRTGATVLASTQVSETYVEEALSPGEFRAAAAEALKAPSIGVVLWSWDALSKSPEKQALLKRLVH